MKVLAIDPGERVGYATAEVVDGVRLVDTPNCWASQSAPIPMIQTEAVRLLDVQTHGIAFLKDFAVRLAESIVDYDVVIYEEYRVSADRKRLMAHVGSDVPTLQLVGMIRLCAWLHPGVKLVKQTPANKSTADRIIAANPLYADIKARIEAAPATHDDAHDTDALRHLAYWHFKEVHP